ncbi:VgrG protein [Klebsiella pneumoniae]|nr:VgrG protein [Klebsiella pneumoniae]
MDTFSMITGTTLNRYQLDIPSCTASLDVEEFSGAEKLSELYYYTITFTSAEKNIDAAQLLSKPAMLTMGGGALQQLADCKRVHGVVTAFRRISSSEDQSKYQMILPINSGHATKWSKLSTRGDSHDKTNINHQKATQAAHS